MGRQIKFTEWDRAVLDDMARRFAPASVRLIDGKTLEAYAGSVPPNHNGETVDIFDAFEMRRLARYHPDIYREAQRGQ